MDPSETSPHLRTTTDVTTTGSGAMRDELAAGSAVGRYIVVECIGRGSAGVVYRAHDARLQRDVALKVLHRRGDSRAARNLLTEARAIAGVRHPNIVSVFDAGTEGEEVFLAMELVEGATLEALARRPEVAPGRAVELAAGAGLGLHALHTAGLVHRDVKPANIMVDSDGRAQLMDLGLACRIHSNPERSHQLHGTPAFLSPELWDAEPASPASDQFAFCVSVWESAVQVHPFAIDDVPNISLVELSRRIRAGIPPAEVTRAHRLLPSWVVAALLRGMSTSPGDRWPSVQALVDALSRSPWVFRRRVGGLAATAALGVGLGLVVRSEAAEPCLRGPGMLGWSAETRARVRTRLASVDEPYGETTARHVVARLDAFSNRWIHTEEHVCEIGVETARGYGRACLEANAAVFRRVVHALREAGPQEVERAHALLEVLPDLGECIEEPDERGLARASPLGREVREALADLEATKMRDGPNEEQLVAIEALAERASAESPCGVGLDVELHHADLLVELSKDLGEAVFLQALRRAESTVWAAFRCQQHDAVLEAADLLVWLTHDDAQARQQTAIWLELATAALDVGAVNPELWAHHWNTRGKLAHHRGEHDVAIDAYTRAADAARGMNDRVAEASLLANEAMVLLDQRRYDDALELQQEALAIRLEVQGPGHPRVADLHNQRTATLVSNGQFDLALVENDRALSALHSMRSGVGRAALLRANALRATIQFQQGELVDASDAFERVAEQIVEERGPDDLELGVVYGNLAFVAATRGQPEEAERWLLRALGVYGAHGKLEEPAAVAVRASLADALAAQRREDESVPHYRAVLVSPHFEGAIPDPTAFARRASEVFRATGAGAEADRWGSWDVTSQR